MSHANQDESAEFSFVESEEALHEAAAEAVGFDDFGEESYREALRVLLEAYDQEAKLTPGGRIAARQGILQTLERRLRSEKLLKRDPSVLDHKIRRPIIIMGLVRTGSTALHYLMGQDPGLQKLESWLSSYPQPRPPRSEWEGHPDFQATKAWIDGMYEADPSLKAVHWMMPDGPDECGQLLAQSFTDDGFEVRVTAPSYSRWYGSAFLRDTYLRHRKLVKLIGSTDLERRWLLKYPVHVRHLRALLEVYPDACIVWTHRDPTRVMHSYASLVGGFRALFERDIDLADITRVETELWASGLERAIECRKERDPSQFIDVHFRDFRADPIGSVKHIYRHFGQELSEEGERRLRDWVQHNPEDQHGRHEYASKDIGMSRGEILDRFSAYMEHFGMKPEKAP